MNLINPQNGQRELTTPEIKNPNFELIYKIPRILLVGSLVGSLGFMAFNHYWLFNAKSIFIQIVSSISTDLV